MRNPILGVSASAAKLTYAQEVLADNPLGFWLFNETSGTTATDQGSGNLQLTYNNGPTLNQSTGLSGITKAVSFDGSNDYADRGQNATYNFAGSSAWSVEFWVKPNNTASNSLFTIRPTSSDSSQLVLVNCFMDIADGKVSAYVGNNSGGFIVITSTNSINNNAWHQIVVTAASGGVLTLYVDGVSNASSSAARYASTTNRALFVAANYSTSVIQYSKGLFAANSLYTTALSQTRVTDHYNAGV